MAQYAAAKLDNILRSSLAPRRSPGGRVRGVVRGRARSRARSAGRGADPEIYRLPSRHDGARIAAEFNGTAPAVTDVRIADEALWQIGVEGRFEHVAGGRAVGWAWSPQHPGFRVPVAVCVGGGQVASGFACRSRDDLVSAGKGDGFHGFSIPLPPDIASRSKSELTVTMGRTPAGRTLPL
jgi:hypothetical protein